MKFPSTSHPQRLRGLTLIELVVVLAILVALVGLVLAFFPGLVARASRSTAASSIQDIARAVQINYTTTLSYGSGYDSLINTNGSALFTGINTVSASQMSVSSLNASDSAALSNAGITYVYHVGASANDSTFAVTRTNNPITIQNGAPVAVLNNSASDLKDTLRGNYVVTGTPTYVVFGLNRGATLVGANSILQDAPVRAGTSATENPTTSYQRYGLVFLIEGTTSRTAKFLGAVAFTSTGILTAEDNLQQYFAN